jgi:hypothetical protein
VKYRVRNGDGELEYESFKHLEEAARLGLVDPDDELLREGETEWKKASTQPSLLKARPSPLAAWNSPLVRWIGLSVVGALFAMWAIHKGSTQDKPELWAAGLTAAFVSAGVLIKVTADAQKRRR